MLNLRVERPPVPDSGGSELQQSAAKIAKLVQENAQLEFIQRQTERLLSAQGRQIRETVRVELERLDAELQTKEQALQHLRAKTDELQTSLKQEVRELQIQLAEKMLLLESRNSEVSNLRATIQRLSQQLAGQASGRK